MSGKPRRKVTEVVCTVADPPDPVYFITYYDEKYRLSMVYFTEEDYHVALALLEGAEEYEISDHGEVKPPEPINLTFWKEACGFAEEE